MSKNTRKIRINRALILLLSVLFALGGAGAGIVTSKEISTSKDPVTATKSDASVGKTPSSDEAASKPEHSSRPETESQPHTPEPEPVDITIAAAGDILTHMPLLQSAADGDDYDMSKLWHRLDEWIGGSDLALCHMEVPIAPEGSAPSGYPMFAAPKSLAGDVKDQGWDGCSTASNHSVDRGWAGVEATLDALDTAGLGASGTARSAEQADSPQIYELERAGRTIQIAHLATAYGLNGLPKPEGMPWAVETFDAETPNVDRLLSQAEAARDSGADLVIASVHCCVEYLEKPTPAQVEVMQTIADSGQVDLVIGHHAHVPQPMKQLPGGPDGTGMWVAYGLGNYISNQSSHCCVSETSNGLVMFATASVPPTGPVRVTGMEWLAVTVDRAGGHQLYPINSATNALGQLSEAEVAKRYDQVLGAVGDEAKEISTPPKFDGSPAVVVARP